MTPTAQFCDQCGSVIPAGSGFCKRCDKTSTGLTNFTRVRELFDQVIAVDPVLREAWLVEHCAYDPALLSELRGMLPREQDSFLAKPAAIPPSLVPPGAPPPSLATTRLAVPNLQFSQPTARMIGPYRLVRELGRGGMGVVYLAVRDDGTFRKNVALKLLLSEQVTSEFVQRFKHERQLLAALDHPNIARILDGGDGPDGTPYYVMEYVEGQPIDRYCDEQRLSLSARIKVFQQICQAVHYLHQNATVHRDLKPANILVSADGVVKLLDFGIAKVVGAGAYSNADLTTAQGTPMTPSYASPEQIQGVTLQKTSDIYSLGVILYLLLTGRPPYQNWEDKLAKLASRKDPPLPSANIREDLRATPESTAQLRKAMLGELDSIVLMALRFEPKERYPSATDLADDLQRFLDGQAVAAHHQSIARKSVRLLRRKRAMIAAMIGFLLLGSFGAWQWHRTNAQNAEIAAREAQLRALLDQLEAGADAVKPDAKKIEDLVKLKAALAGELPAIAAAHPERAAQHQALLERSVRYLDRVSGAAPSRADLGLALADAYQEIAVLQASVSSTTPAARATAVKTYQKAAQVLDTSVANPGDTRLAERLAQVRQRIKSMEGTAVVADSTSGTNGRKVDIRTAEPSGAAPSKFSVAVVKPPVSKAQATQSAVVTAEPQRLSEPVSDNQASVSTNGSNAAAIAELQDRVVSVESRIVLAEQSIAPLQRSLEAKGQMLSSNIQSDIASMRVRLSRAKRQLTTGDESGARESLVAAQALADRVLRAIGR